MKQLLIAPRKREFLWWCKRCGVWTSIDDQGMCTTCRHELEGKTRPRRRPFGEQIEHLRGCRRCSRCASSSS